MSAQVSTKQGKYGVLVVEDSANDEALTLRALRRTKLPLIVTVARDGDEANKVLKSDLWAIGLAEAPRLILLDLKLPKFTGLEVLESIRTDRRTASIPVVCLTSSDEPKDTSTAFGLGANSYVRKPVDFDRYLEVVARTVEYWLTVNYWPA